MTLKDVLLKCADAPDVTLLQEKEYDKLVLESQKESGSMVFFSLFPGITLAYIHVHAASWPAPDLSAGTTTSQPLAPYVFNYCVNGRCELLLNTGSYVYVTTKQLSLSRQFAMNHYIYPTHLYEGIELFLEPEIICQRDHQLIELFDLDCNALFKKYCPGSQSYIAPAPQEALSLCQSVWALEEGPLPQKKLAVLSLLCHLANEQPPCTQPPHTFYTEAQVAIAKKTQALITEDLRVHYPAHELACRFSVSETSLKNYFRGVYGQNISVYLRELRMERAAGLLSTTRQSVSDIAAQVGYSSQSKFAAVFRQQYGVSPLEYRRRAHLAP